MKKQHVYIGTAALIVMSLIYPPYFAVVRNGRNAGAIKEYGWQMITGFWPWESINVPVLLVEFVVIGILSFLLLKTTKE